MKTYLVSYRYKGKEYSFDIEATCFEDAENRLRFIKGNGSIDGELVLRVGAPEFLGKLFRK